MESVVRAPAGGTLLSRLVNAGDPVVPLTSYQAGTDLATIADMSDLIFQGTVDEIDVGKLAVGLPARLKVGALPDTPVKGKLVRIAPAGYREGQREAVRGRDRARPEPEGGPARRLLRERRPRDPREDRRPARPGAAGHLRGRRKEGVRRDSGARAQGPAEEDRDQDRSVGRPERRGGRRGQDPATSVVERPPREIKG